jgi:hypothetical protein
MTTKYITYKSTSRILFILLIITASITPVFATTHIILFGGVLGETYSPNFLTLSVGYTIQWQGSFSLHPLSSATIPIGATAWHTGSGSVFSYPVLIEGTYDYQCDFHGDFGMVGSFVAVISTPINAPNLLTPANTSTDISTNPTIVWNSALNATKYHLQVSSTSDFLNIVNESTNIIDTLKQLSGLNNNTLYFWRVNGSNDIATSAWSVVRNFKTVVTTPISPLLVSPDSASLNQPTSIILTWHRASDIDSYYVQIASDQIFSTILNVSPTTDTFTLISNLGKDSTYYWRVGSKNALGVSPWSNIWKFITAPNTVKFLLSSKWNMVSLPLLVNDARFSTLFPDAASLAFYYNFGYFKADTLNNKIQHWA